MVKKQEKIKEKSTKKGTPEAAPVKERAVSYEAKDIYVLEGLEPVRKRPAMYIGSTGVDGLHHLIWEVVDNCIDEAMGGYAKNIKVELFANGRVAVADDGRGIPVDIHPHTKKSALETVLCTLHAGGKFGGESYKVAGGLHGVGVSVVNALSKWLRVEVCRNGSLYSQEYEKGQPRYKVRKEGKCGQTGTKVIFEPDSQIFQKVDFDLKKIVSHLRQQAYLTPKLRIEIIDSRSGQPEAYGFYFEGGLKSFVRYLIGSKEPVQNEFFYQSRNYEKILVESAFVYTNEIEAQEVSFANNIYTPDGGMHLTGFRSALTRTINDFGRREGYLKEADENLIGDDVREGLVAAVSVKLGEPQFEGQTKARLGNPEARTAVETAVNESLKEFFERYPADGRKIVEKCLLTAKARQAAKAAKETVLRKGALEGMTLPGKLADCSSRNPAESELFIVEGDSAGGCLAGDVKVALVDGRNISFKDLVEENKQGKENFCYTIKNDGNIGVELIKNPRKTKNNAKVVKIILDNNEELICTPDHKFMLRDGSYKMAKDLIPDDSLMPLYKKYSEIAGRITIEGYEMVLNHQNFKWIFTHSLADKYNLERSIYEKGKIDAVHHIDFNKLNNNPNNLVRIPKDEHLLLHSKILKKTIHREDVKEKSRRVHQSEVYREKMKKTMTTPKMREMLSKRAKKQWQSEEYKNYMAQKFLEFYRNNSDYKEKNSKLLNEVQKLYWGNTENRKKQAKRVKEYFEKNPEKKKWLSAIAKNQWTDLNLRKWRAETTKKQWTEEFREKRKEAYNQTYLRKALGVLRSIYNKNGMADKKQYNQIRKTRNDKSLIKYETICQRFFNGNEEKLKEAVLNYNHRIKEIVLLKEKVDVYDLEVPGNHNFALASGVFVHNSAKQGRDRRTQAILPLRGKILNVEKARMDKMLLNQEIRNLIIAIGTAIGDSFDLSKIRYHKIVIMTDADTDGAHIRTLLLTLFYRYFASIIENGYLFIAQPPLFRLQRGKEAHYAYKEAEKDRLLKSWAEGGKVGVGVQRYKGLGEMNPEQLWETTMNSASRQLKQVMIEDAPEADRLFDILMGEEVEPRKNFIQAHATAVKNLDI